MIPNFSVVREGSVFRGGQPSEPADWDSLYEMGVRWVLKLNEKSEGLDLYKTIYQPISFMSQILPAIVDVSAALATLCDSKLWPMFFHCSHGEDRTGLLAAMFRVLVDKWTPAAAEKEMLAYGFHRELLGLWITWEQFKASHVN